MSKCFDEDYEIGRIQFISEFKDKQIKKLEKESKQKNKRTRRWNKRVKASIDKSNHSIKSKCFNVLSKEYYLPYKNSWVW